MTEPVRLRDENPSALERELLEAGRSYRGSSVARRRTLATLGLAGTTLTTTATSAAATSLFEKLGAAKLFAISTLSVAVVAPVAYLAFAPDEPEPPAASAPAVPSPSDPETAERPEAAPAPEPRAEETESEPAVPTAKAEPRSTAASALSAELAALDAARQRLAGGDAKGALSLLDAYTRDFPRRRLNLEAEVLRIDALAKDGQNDAAQRRAEAFLKRHPKSVLASRVRGYVGDPSSK